MREADPTTPPSKRSGTPPKRRRASLPDGEERRSHILAAAQRVFEVKGLEGANMRAIAREAGYSVAGLYFYYSSQEDIYADLLSTSLKRLQEFTHEATRNAVAPGDRAAACSMAFYDYYATRPDELSLGFYLFRGVSPRGLTRELNEGLNSELWRALAGVYHPMVEAGKPPDEALADLTSSFGHCVGLLLLVHTGRIRMFRQDGRELFRTFVDDRIRGSGKRA